MSSIRSTQNRHIFLRRKYCFLPIALSPPVGRCEALIGRPPLKSAILVSLLIPSARLLAQRARFQNVRSEARGLPLRWRPQPAWPEPGKGQAPPEPLAEEQVCETHACREPSSASRSSSSSRRCAP